MKSRLNFIKAFLRNPKQVGNFIQSSQFLADKLIEPIEFDDVKCIVELGAGTGIVTKRLLDNMPEDCTLLCFEIDHTLAKQLKADFDDPRLKVIQDSAENMARYLKKHDYSEADYIISGLPLVTLPKNTTSNILNEIRHCLKEDGKYMQLQYSLISKKRLKRIFPRLSIYFTILNVPPAFVYVAHKSRVRMEKIMENASWKNTGQ